MSHIISIITDVQSFPDMMFRKIKGIQAVLLKVYQAIYDYKKILSIALLIMNVVLMMS